MLLGHPGATGDICGHSMFTESVNCAECMRVALKTSMVPVRDIDNVDRDVRYQCVHKVWNWLARAIPTESRLIAGCPVAWTCQKMTLHLQLQALHDSQALGTIDTYRKGELWVRLGIVSVPLWKIRVMWLQPHSPYVVTFMVTQSIHQSGTW